MQKWSVPLKIKIHFVLYYKYYSYLCNTEKEINGQRLPHFPVFTSSLVECLI